MLNTSVEAICYKVRALRDGTFPLMLRLTQNRKRKYLSLGMSVEERFWDFKKNTPKRNCPDRDAILAVIERKSKQYREQITQFKVTYSRADYPITGRKRENSYHSSYSHSHLKS